MRNRTFHVAVDPSADTTVTVVQGRTNHWFHLFMTLVTGGLWLPIWLVAAARARRNVSVTATATARASVTDPRPQTPPGY